MWRSQRSTKPTAVLTRVSFRMGVAVASKLEAFTKLSDDDRAALARLSRSVRVVEARRDLICEGDKPRHAHLMLDGWACRYKTLPDGKRQIVSFFVPGDFADVNAHIVKRMDHSIGAITRLRVAMIAPEDIEAIVAERPRITEAFSWHEQLDVSTQREWTLNVGQRSAYERVAHLLVELYLRLRTVGRVTNGACDFPLT